MNGFRFDPAQLARVSAEESVMGWQPLHRSFNFGREARVFGEPRNRGLWILKGAKRFREEINKLGLLVRVAVCRRPCHVDTYNPRRELRQLTNQTGCTPILRKVGTGR